MGYDYRCDICGCYLDPGEGNICDECQEVMDQMEKDGDPCPSHKMGDVLYAS